MCTVANITAVFDPNGDVRPCCLIPQTLGNLNQDSWETLWSGETAESLRKDIFQGKNQSCQHCDLYQNSSKQVYREQEIERVLREVDLRISNRCNCKCLMCSPSSSDQFTGDLYEFPVERILPILKQNVHTITRIHFAGGEPLLYKDYVKVLKLFQDEDQMKYLTLSYNTNCTIFPGEEILYYWDQAYCLSIDLSIDGIGNINNQIRVNSSWNRIQKVLEKYLEYREKNKERVYLHIHPAISIYNLGDLWRLDEFMFQKKIPVRWGNCVDFPESMSIWSMSYQDRYSKCELELEKATTPEFQTFIKRIIERGDQL